MNAFTTAVATKACYALAEHIESRSDISNAEHISSIADTYRQKKVNYCRYWVFAHRYAVITARYNLTVSIYFAEAK